VLDDPLDHAVFPGGIASLEDHQDPVGAADVVLLELGQLDLQSPERGAVLLLR
jgi:hypothetical protein